MDASEDEPSFVKDEKTKKYLCLECEHDTTLLKDIKLHHTNMHGPNKKKCVDELCGGQVFNTNGNMRGMKTLSTDQKNALLVVSNSKTKKIQTRIVKT